MSAEYPERIITAINRMLETLGRPRVSLNYSIFCMDEDVDYSSVWRIHRSKLIPTAEVADVLAQLVSRGPAWLHANLVETNESLPLITIRVGESVGNPNPSINTSVEVNKVVTIIDT